MVHLVSATALATVGWLCQALVYPAFALVGATEWSGYHLRHGRAITLVVGPPWVAQAVAVLALLVLDLPVGLALGTLALTGVVVTVVAAVPAHQRLTASDGVAAPAELRRLLRANLARTLVWTVAAGLSAVLLLTE